MSDTERKLFGTDGIRGVANLEPMTAEMALRLGQAVARRFSAPGRRGRIVIGKDTRLSGYMLESAMEAGIVSAGADVWLVGPLPTPGIAFITSSMRADAGVVISASHNPFEDNGIKLFASDGFKLPDAEEAEIEGLMGGNGWTPPRGAGIGRAHRIADAEGRYVQYLKSAFPRGRRLDGLRLVVDCAHGAGYQVAPQVFEELGAEVTALGTAPNGTNINETSGALHPEVVAAEVRRRGAHIGVALDGDADRVMLCDERGAVVDGDAILAILGTRMLARGRLPQNTVVATVMSNLGLERALEAAGGHLVRAAVGDRYVVETMRARGFSLGGEQSGHVVSLDHGTTGDGVLAALQVLEVMTDEGKTLSELASVLTRYPQVLLNFVVASKRPIDELPEVGAEIARATRELGKQGRVLVRYSGTEAKARVMVEGADEARIKAHAESIAAALKAALAG